MASPKRRFKILGEYEYGGVTFGGYVNRRILESPGIVKCHDDDVFLVSYPKAATSSHDWRRFVRLEMTSPKRRFKTLGEYEYGGVTFGGYVNRRILESPGIVKCHDDDVFLVSYPKAGTTWALEIVSLIMNGCDVDANKSAIQQIRHPMLETSVDFLGCYLVPQFLKRLGFPDVSAEEFSSAEGLEQIERQGRPRLIKSHLPYQFFPTQALEKKCKIIYLARNPKDSAVSYFYHYRLFHFVSPWSDFYDLFVNNNVSYGSWFDHVLGWWNHADEDNILYLKYEDMKKDIDRTIRSIALFLDKSVSDDDVKKIADLCEIQRMKKNPAVNMERLTPGAKKGEKFIRKGIVGDWANHFTVAQNKEFERLYKEQMDGSDLDFEW